MISLLMLAAGAAGAIPADARRAIEAANAAWLPAMRAQNAAAIVEPYADGAVFVAATGEEATGRPAIERMMRDRFARSGRTVDGRLEQDGVAMAGSMIYEWGHADLEVVRESQAPSHVRGRYLTVWQRDGTGRWRIIRNLSLPD